MALLEYLNCSMTRGLREFIMCLWLRFMGPMAVLYPLNLVKSHGDQGFCALQPRWELIPMRDFRGADWFQLTGQVKSVRF